MSRAIHSSLSLSMRVGIAFTRSNPDNRGSGFDVARKGKR